MRKGIGYRFIFEQNNNCEVMGGVINKFDAKSFWISFGAWIQTEDKKTAEKLFKNIKNESKDYIDLNLFKDKHIVTDTIPQQFSNKKPVYCSLEFNIYLKKDMDMKMLQDEADKFASKVKELFNSTDVIKISRRR